MITHWQDFLEHREYSKDVTAKTLRYYRQAYHAWGKYLPEEPDRITDVTVRKITVELRRSGLSAISTNTYLRGLKAFLRFMKISIEVPFQNAPKVVPRTFNSDQVDALVRACPRSTRERRVVLAAAIVADTGLRAMELLNLQHRDVELDARILHVRSGKGRKDRDVPLSKSLRQRLSVLVREGNADDWIFETRRGHAWSYRNSLRDLGLYCRRLGLSGPKLSWHTFRHSFATNYIKAGGDVAMLSRILGHATISMTMRYVHLQTEDLVRVHDKFTMLR